MMNGTLLELYAQLRTADMHERRRSQPRPPRRPGPLSAWRGRAARGLVALGLRIDAEASRAAVGSAEAAPRLNGSDA